MSLTEAQGYFDLALYDEAWQVIDDLPPDERSTSETFSLRLRILDATERWEKCQYLAEGMVRDFPEWPLPTLLGSKALDKQGQVEAALAFLVAREDYMQDKPGFWYQFGSYHARLGDVLRAKQAIARLSEVAPNWRVKVLEDPAFESVWESLG